MNTGGEIAHVTGQLPAKTDRRFGTLGAVLHVRNFRLLWIGQGISVLGDQFYIPRYAQRDDSKQTKRNLTICARKQKSGKVVGSFNIIAFPATFSV